MKIGVVTTHYASNYGALLQAYALQQHLINEEKADAEILAYYPKHYRDYWRKMPKIVSFKSFAIFCYCCLTPHRILQTKKRYKRYLDFVEKRIKCSKSYFSHEEIEADDCEYDALICGSDQIWNASRHSQIDPLWFLSIGGKWRNVTKIAYAPSVADPIPEEKREQIKGFLTDFSAVSVREFSDIEQIQPLYSGIVHHVCDPVFLLSADEWSEISDALPTTEPYVLCYFLKPDQEAVSVVKKIREVTGLKVVNIDINNYDRIHADISIPAATPEEFVSYIKHAEYVITNSFHCTAFSVLFKKSVFVIKKRLSNSRMESLLSIVGLKERIVSFKDVEKMPIDKYKADYSGGYENLEVFIKESKSYLHSALGSTENELQM